VTLIFPPPLCSNSPGRANFYRLGDGHFCFNLGNRAHEIVAGYSSGDQVL